MKKVWTVSLLSSLSLFATEAPHVDSSMGWVTIWLLVSLMVIGLMFWSMYKAMKTKNPKYGYGIALSVILMVGLMLI